MSVFVTSAVIGCPNEVRGIDVTANALVSRTDDHLVVKCNWTLREFHMKCVGSRWVGDLTRCNQGKSNQQGKSVEIIRPTFTRLCD